MADDGNAVLLSSAGVTEGVQVSLHPLPLLNISEHYTRVRVQEGREDVKVIGALIGVQQGREIEITNSFELAMTPDGQAVNHEFFTDRQAQFKQVFPAFEFLGWYTVGQSPTSLDLSLHTQLLIYNESPLFLTLSASGLSNSKAGNLPIEIFETVVDIVAGKSIHKFVKIAGGEGGYKIETGEAERIAVESASRQAVASATGSRGGQESSESTLIAGLATQRNAISMLQTRIEVIYKYLNCVQTGQVTPDHETLRQISSLVSSITSSSSTSLVDEDFAAEFDREQNDVLLTSILGQMTKNTEITNCLIDKFAISQNRDQGDELGGMLGGGGPPGGAGRRGVGARGKGAGFASRRNTAESHFGF